MTSHSASLGSLLAADHASIRLVAGAVPTRRNAAARRGVAKTRVRPEPKCVIDRSRACGACVAPGPSQCPYAHLLDATELSAIANAAMGYRPSDPPAQITTYRFEPATSVL